MGLTISSALRRFGMPGLSRNAAFALTQALVVMACLFLTYRVVIGAEGIAALGLWALLMVFAGVAGTFDISGVSALSRFVARHDVEFTHESQAALVHTVLLTGFAINAVMVLILMLAAPFALPSMLEPAQLAEGTALLPWVGALMIVNPISLGVTSSLDGLMRADLRAMVVSVAALFGLAMAWLMIPRFGIAGLAMGQLMQQLVTIIAGWLLMRARIGGLGWLPFKWRRSVFRVTTGYAMRLNLVGVLGLMLEPLTKVLINGFGGIVAVGAYEIGSKLIIQIRTLVVYAATPLVPVLASLPDDNSSRAEALLSKVNKAAMIASIVAALLSFIGAPVVSIVLTGSVISDILQINAVLVVGWCANITSFPSYFLAQAKGVLRWNILSHLFRTIIIVFGAFVVSNTDNLLLFVSLALVVSSFITTYFNLYQFKLSGLFSSSIIYLASVSIALTIMAIAIYNGADIISECVSEMTGYPAVVVGV